MVFFHRCRTGEVKLGQVERETPGGPGFVRDEEGCEVVKGMEGWGSFVGRC